MLRILILSLVISFCLNANAQSPFTAKNKSKIVKATSNDIVVINGKKSSFDNKFKSKSYIGTPLNLQNRKKQSNIVEKQNLKFNRAPFTGMPILIKGYKNNNISNTEGLSKAEVLGLSKQFLKNIQPEICVEDTDQEFVLLTQEKENGYSHLKFQQVYKGVPIYGAEIFVHLDKNASLSFNGRNQPTPFLENLTPSLSKDEAIQEVIEDVKAHASYHQMGEKELEMYKDGQYVTELIILPSKEDFGMFDLAYHITIRPNFMERFEYFIDAQTGEILNHYDNTCSINGLATANATTLNGNTVEINTYQYQGNYYLFDGSRDMYSGPTNGDLPPQGTGYIETLDFENKPYSSPAYVDIVSSNNTWSSDRSAVSAHYNAGESYEYFKNVHNRKSINGENGDILSFVNVADENGGGFDNAFWNGQYMFYGNGKNAFKPLAGALDVAGHEMSHGVIQSTANLNYQGESGAINESMADVFGVLIDRDDWTLGEEVVQPSAFPSGALRSVIDPHNGGSSLSDPGWQPRHYDERYRGSQDNGGVHINSGIPNYAFYLVASTIGKDKAERIYYSALKNYLTRSSQFIDLRIAVLEAAMTISGVTTTDMNTIRTAFGNVGIGEGAGTLPEPDIEENNGGEFVLSLDNNADNPGSLYLSTTVPDGYVELSQEAIFRKPSISDNGCHLYYIVETDKRVRYINLCNGSNYTEELKNISGGVSRWDNVAVSKNGEMLALIPEEYDNAIYIYNISNNQIRKFDLYTPTFTEGVSIETVQYADAIEWDYTGEFVMYDAYNIIKGVNDDEDIDYWDVGVINVLDGNDWGDGEISQIFTNLPEGVSIGNPTFSKNSPYIIAFDYWDVNNDEIKLMAANLETSDIGTIVENSGVLTYPSYSVDDRRMIYDAQGTFNGEEVAVINRISLQADKINKSGNGQQFIEYAFWGVWFAEGERALPTGLEEVSVVDLSIAPNPFVDAFELNFSSDEKINISIYNLDGQLVKSYATQNGEDQLRVNTVAWPTGTYILNIQGKSFSENRKLVKM